MVQARLDAEGSDGEARAARGERLRRALLARRASRRCSAATARSATCRDAIDRLAARELVARAAHARRRQATSEFTFAHALVREAAYAMLTDEDRALGHRLAGAWLEQAGLGDAMVLAEHFRRGGEPARAVALVRARGGAGAARQRPGRRDRARRAGDRRRRGAASSRARCG